MNQRHHSMINRPEFGHENKSPLFCGVEIGAVTAKLVKIDHAGRCSAQVRRHEGNPAIILKEFINERSKTHELKIAVTGQTAKSFLDYPYFCETQCLERSIHHYQLAPDIILSLGGETFTVYTVKEGHIKNFITTAKCAAGSGEFIVQQLQRMGLSLAQGVEASHQGIVVPMATRCSVHCKSDATHKLNKGECRIEDIAKTLIHDLSKKVARMIESIHWPADHILVAGGLTLNTAFLQMLRSHFATSKIQVLTESAYLEAFGAALNGADQYRYGAESHVKVLDVDDPPAINLKKQQPLTCAKQWVDYRKVAFDGRKVDPNAPCILSIDAGSTTTKAILLSLFDESVVCGCYLRTHGNPVQAARQCLAELIQKTGNVPLHIVQAAVTGSGREMVSVFLDNCLSFNEIIAHARAAAKETADVETVFEIGGQDSKFISFVNGIPVDYAMNEGCSAGTGSFLEESMQADLSIPAEQINERAQRSRAPILFGEHCAAFINTDLKNAFQQGADPDDVIAGLVYAIADNYLSRVVGVRPLGRTILFQGGVALNHAVALALAERIRRKIIVPSQPELMGCIGAALLVKDRLESGLDNGRSYQLDKVVSGAMSVKGHFTCQSCENRCHIKKIKIKNRVYPFGGLCSKFENSRKNTSIEEGQNFLSLRNRLMFEAFGPVEVKNSRGVIGLPLALTTYDYFPFYAKLINALGYEVALSHPSTEGNAKSKGPICYPGEIAHGSADDLIQQNVDYLFYPRAIEAQILTKDGSAFTCTSINTIPDLLANAFASAGDKILSPYLGFSHRLRKLTISQIIQLGKRLRVDKKTAVAAYKQAMDHYCSYQKRYREMISTSLNQIKSEPSIILAGRSYMVCPSETNIALDRKICSRGYHVVYADALPMYNDRIHSRNVWYSTQRTMNAIHWARENPEMYVCLLSCFSCSPDAVMYHVVRKEMQGKPLCYLEIDSHSAHAGFETRVGAFLDIIEENRLTKQRSKTVCHASKAVSKSECPKCLKISA